MYILLVSVHIIICLVLILTILLQAGRGGGLTEAFSGSEQAQSVLGTQAPEMLKKATEISAILFLVTSLGLGMLTARRGKSLFDTTPMNIPGGSGPAAVKPLAIPAGPAEDIAASDLLSPAEKLAAETGAPLEVITKTADDTVNDTKEMIPETTKVPE